MRCKVDRYEIYNRGRNYEVLAFPESKNAWAFYEDPDDQHMIDGDPKFYAMLQHALAVLISDPYKVIYLPIKHRGEIRYGGKMTYDAVLLRPELQFRRSEWYDLKPKLDRKHWGGRYTIRHDQKKIDDWWLKQTKKCPQWIDHWGHRIDMQFYARAIDELIGETVFLVLPEDIACMYHRMITQALDEFDGTQEFGVYAGIGYIMPVNDGN